jgi:hypothetical protein
MTKPKRALWWSEKFAASALVPKTFEHLGAQTAFVMPLTCGKDCLGICVIPASPRDGSFYETLGELFATVLKVLELRRSTARPSVPPQGASGRRMP